MTPSETLRDPSLWGPLASFDRWRGEEHGRTSPLTDTPNVPAIWTKPVMRLISLTSVKHLANSHRKLTLSDGFVQNV